MSHSSIGAIVREGDHSLRQGLDVLNECRVARGEDDDPVALAEAFGSGLHDRARDLVGGMADLHRIVFLVEHGAVGVPDVAPADRPALDLDEAVPVGHRRDGGIDYLEVSGADQLRGPH